MLACRVIYQQPLAYLLAMEGLALLRGWAGDYDQAFVAARLAEVRRLLDDETLSRHPGVLVEEGATGTAYAQWSSSYDDPHNGLFDLDAPFVREVTATLPVGAALDAACGTGRLTAELVGRGHWVVGVDGSAAMLQQARQRVPDADFLLGDLHRLPLPDDAVDLVVNGLALTHVEALAPVLAEFARVLRPGGHLVVSDVHPELVLRGSVVKALGPAGRPQQAATHRHRVGDLLRAALAAGFAVRRFDEQPRPTPPDQQEPPPPPTPTQDLGTWQDWPWTLHGLVPEATRAAWDQPSVVLWHLQLD